MLLIFDLDQCEKYAVGLLEQCRSTEEVMSLLSKGSSLFSNSSSHSHVDYTAAALKDDVEYLSNIAPGKLIPDLPRLEMALKYQQRKVQEFYYVEYNRILNSVSNPSARLALKFSTLH